MSQPIQNYPIIFPFGATSAPYSAAHPHKGNDLPLSYEPVIVGDTQIGVSGATGMVQGPHCHVQAGRDLYAQNAIDSRPYIGKPGVVARTGAASEWGNFVCVKVDDVYVYYCHLNQITVSVGKVIGENNVALIQDADNWRSRLNKVMQRERGRDLSDAEFRPWVGQDFLHYVEAVQDNAEADAWYNFGIVGRTAVTDNWQQQIADLQSKLATDETTITTLQTAPQTPADVPEVVTAEATVSAPKLPALTIWQRFLLALAKTKVNK